MSELLRVENLWKSYREAGRELRVLGGLALSLADGEAVAIVGMSGAGKSTFLHLVGGLDRPDKGAILFRGEDIARLSKAEMNRFRNRSVGFVFQFHHLLPEFSALENVMMPALAARERPAAARDRARRLLDEVGLAERETHRPAKLSGGEQQRVALARALVNNPALLLADEPTGNLDLQTGEKVIDLLWEETVRRGRSLMIVTHEPLIARRADRIYRLTGGRLEPLEKNPASAAGA